MTKGGRCSKLLHQLALNLSYVQNPTIDPGISQIHSLLYIYVYIPLNRLQSICDMMYRLETSALCNMMGVVEVQNSLIGYLVVQPLTLQLLRGSWTAKPWKQMTMRKTKKVERRLLRLGAVCLQNAWQRAPILLGLVSNRCTQAITLPSNSVPQSLLIVMGEKDYHTIPSHTFTAMNRDMPDPSPQPSCNISSKRMTMKPAKKSWRRMTRMVKVERLLGSPYIPEQIQATASHRVIMRDNNLLAPSYSLRSCSSFISRLIILTPTSN